MNSDLKDILDALAEDQLAVDPEGDMVDRVNDTIHSLEDVIEWVAEARSNLDKLEKIIEWAKAAPFRKS